MDAPTNVIDSKVSWVKKQIDEYVATYGARPTFRHGSPLVLLTYKGRKSGQWRRTCLIGAPYDDFWLVVASMGGSDHHPAWYPNLVANPTAWLQAGAEYFPVTARTATSAEKPPLWDYMVSLFPNYADYQTKTKREIPVVILTPISDGNSRGE
jgi:F420H(2)-dependent quinone reductase